MTKINISELETRLFINNEFVNSESGKTFTTVNPATEEAICNVQEANEADVNKAVSDNLVCANPLISCRYRRYFRSN